MATSKPGTPTEKTGAPHAPNNKKMILIVAVVALLGGGGAAYFLMKPTHGSRHDSPPAEAAVEAAPKYVALGTFTANLIHEEGDRYLQVAISIKVTNPDLEEKIKASNPEILHHVNMLLQSKRPSELATLEGKDKLSVEIKGQIEQILGLAKALPINNPNQPSSSPTVVAQSQGAKTGIEEVLFTSFIIQ